MNNDYQLKARGKMRDPALSVKEIAERHNLNAISLGLYLFNDNSISVEFCRGRRDYYKVTDINIWLKANTGKVAAMTIKG